MLTPGVLQKDRGCRSWHVHLFPNGSFWRLSTLLSDHCHLVISLAVFAIPTDRRNYGFPVQIHRLPVEMAAQFGPWFADRGGVGAAHHRGSFRRLEGIDFCPGYSQSFYSSWEAGMLPLNRILVDVTDNCSFARSVLKAAGP